MNCGVFPTAPTASDETLVRCFQWDGPGDGLALNKRTSPERFPSKRNWRACFWFAEDTGIKWFNARPHPGPLPPGEGETLPALWRNGAFQVQKGFLGNRVPAKSIPPKTANQNIFKKRVKLVRCFRWNRNQCVQRYVTQPNRHSQPQRGCGHFVRMTAAHWPQPRCGC